MSRKHTAEEMREMASVVSKDAYVNYDGGAAYISTSKFNENIIAAMLRQAADDMDREEREKKYEYAVRMDGGEVYGQFHDITEARDEAEFVNSDGLIICHAVRRPVGEWEEIKE